MFIEPILALILLRYLRKMQESKTLLPGWNKIFITGTVFSIALIILGATIHKGKIANEIILWSGHALMLAILALIFLKPELNKAKQIAYAALPLVLLSFISDIIEKVDNSFYNEWSSTLDMASLFAIVWMIAMFIVNGRQRKALEKERLKTLEIEKENQITERLKAALEVQVNERTAELTQQKEALQQTLNELKSTQAQLIQSEKMASLGELTAGIAHEIQNPLNFVNNFSEVSTELIKELVDEVEKGNTGEVKIIANDLVQNLEKINHHGKRADAIVKGMLQHSRSSTGIKEPVNLNALAEEYFRLAYHGLRAKDKSFNATLKSSYDEKIGDINVVPQEIGRVILNLITNAFYAVNEKKKQTTGTYDPTVFVSTHKTGTNVEITVRDNGNGIPAKILDKIFQPFFTTKPSGQGTGLGLSMSYDIVKGHDGLLTVNSKEGEGTEFVIRLPLKHNS